MRKRLLNLCLTALMSVVCTAAWALSDVGGVYQIGSAADLEAFAQLVNDGQVNANAVLTADIDRGVDGTMIGTAENRYQGTFEGAGHTIKINMFPEEINAGLFRYTGSNAVIQNLKVTGTITTASKFAGGIVARNKGIVRGCYVDVTINSAVAGDATHGGLAAVTNYGSLIEDCLVKIAITGDNTTNCGGVVGWAEERTNIVNCLVVSNASTFNYADASNGHSSNIARAESNTLAVDLETYNADPYANRPGGACYNNYVTVDWGGTNPATTVVPLEDLADGRICYQLNNDQSNIAWVQTIGTDPFPVPAAFGTGRVYASVATDCAGLTEEAATYSNSGSDQAEKHSFDKYGVCTACGCFNFHYFEFDDPTKFDKTDRAILLKSKEDIDVAEGWNRVANCLSINMKMAADIEYIAEPGQYIFFNSGNDNVGVRGNFNGDGHTLTLEMSEIAGRGGLFPVMWGNVENLILHGTIGTTGQNTGSIAGRACMALVRNVYSDIDINSDLDGDNSSGGMFGWMGGVEKTVENCIYAGDFTTPRDPSTNAGCVRIGGFSGWAATKTYFKNCAFLGNLIGAGGSGNIENSQHFTRMPGNGVKENCYVVNTIEGPDVTDLTDEGVTHYEKAEGIANGELAFFLNSKQNGLERFYQLIGTDPEPMPIAKEGALVYSVAANYSCDGTPIGTDVAYSNSASGSGNIPPHEYEDGWCKNCGQMDENFITPVDGWYEISNGAELAWWSVYASAHTDASAKLTEDIDMAGYMDRFTPPAIYVGTFDGQGHKISNFVINKPGAINIGLIGAVGDGAVVKNVYLDETCELFAANYAGVIGTTSGSGTIYVTGVGFEGKVGVGTRNAAGIVGVCSGGSMNMIITNCWVSGEITSGVESGAICGYSGAGSVVTNCWSTCKMQASAIYSSDSFTRGSAKVVNCYEADIEGVDQSKQQHYNPTAADRKTITLPLEEVANGTLCYNLNGKQFAEPVWYQTLEEDAHPYPFDNHGVVVYGAGQYFSIPDSELSDVVAAVQHDEQEAIDGVIATQSLLDAWSAAVEALDDVESLEAYAEAITAIETAKAAAMENAAIYQAYINECERVKTFLEENAGFEGDLRDALEAYLTDVEEPSDDNPLGTYEYIIDVHTATGEEIQAETERVTKWLQDAIISGYIPGDDVSKLIPNGDFSKQRENWNGGFSTDYGTTQTEDGRTIVGVEAWDVTGDQYQTVEGVKPGYYLIGTHAAFRPSNSRYSYNYASGIYANGIFNYFPAVIEDPVSVEDAVDGENCNLGIATSYDLPIYEDYFTTEGEDVIVGYVVHGETGMAIAAKADRYKVYTIAKVGEDGKLTIGIKNPGTHYSNDWTGWSGLNVTYCGDDEGQTNSALDLVLENMVERAQTIIDFNTGVDIYNTEVTYADNRTIGPNFPAELRDQLQGLVDQVEETEGVEAKAALVKEFSDLFQAIYDGKQAYVSLYDYAEMLSLFESFNLDLVEKDDAGDYFDTGEQIFSPDETEVLYNATEEIYAAFENGTYSTEEALNPQLDEAAAAVVAAIMPEQDEDGYYLIGNPKQFAAYRAIASEKDKYAKGKLIADVDMAGVAMLPIGHNRGENAVHIFAGELDGQGHALENVYIDDARIPSDGYAEPATLFYELQNATVKNLKLTGEMFTSHQFSGPVTRWMSGKSTIDNVEIAVAFHLAPNLSGDTSSGGVIGRNGSANSVISNCLVKTHLIGDGAEEGVGPFWYVGGVCGWADAALPIKNTLILSEYTNVGAEGDNSQTIARGAGASATNVFVSQYFRGQQGTLVTDEQLASGEITWKLNGQSGDDPYWFQTLGTEAAPHLFGGDAVYYYGGLYTNDKPNPQLNAYAYNLEATYMGEKVVVTFNLNAEAEAVEVRFSNGYTQAVEGEFTAGSYRVEVPASALGDDPTALSYEVAVTGKGTLDVVKVGSYKVWGPYGMAINNNPASKGFGQVLLAESWIDVYNNNGFVDYHSADKVGALFAFDQNFEPINAEDGTPGFYGGLDIQGETPLAIVDGYTLDLQDLCFSKDGRLFVARAGATSASPIWEINPEDLNEPWKPVFTGGELDEATGITYVGDEEQSRMAVGMAAEGKGDDLKLYLLGGQRSNGALNVTDFNCAFYDLGVSKQYNFSAPSGYIAALDGAYVATPYQAGICADGQGGLWFIQRATPSETTPGIKHFDAEGNEDYSNISAQFGGGRMTVTADGNYIAIPTGNSTIVLYETNYVPMENGRIFLNPKKTINVGETSIASFAFDWAGNLYVASGGTETFSRYAIPYENKLVVTPGNAIGTGGDGDANSDGVVDIADVTYVLTLMARNGYETKADVNGDGTVDIADVTNILTIMASQEQ